MSLGSAEEPRVLKGQCGWIIMSQREILVKSESKCRQVLNHTAPCKPFYHLSCPYFKVSKNHLYYKNSWENVGG